MKYILGFKDGMTQVFDERGFATPVTVINVPTNKVSSLKTEETDGYTSVQLAVGERSEKRITQAVQGHLKKAGLENMRSMREFRVDSTDLELGSDVSVDLFQEGDKVIISSVSKGRGFQGGVKRHGMSGGRRSHGNKHSEREIGSIGAQGPARVFKGQKMPGRMGSDRVTIKNLVVVKVDTDNNRLLIKGSIAGKRGDLVEIKTTA